MTDELAEMDGMTPNMLVVLGENQIKTIDDLGDLASDELMEMDCFPRSCFGQPSFHHIGRSPLFTDLLE